MSLGSRLSSLLTYDSDDGELQLQDTRVGLWDAEILVIVHNTFEDVIGEAANRIVTDRIRDTHEQFFEEMIGQPAYGVDDLNQLLELISQMGYGRVEHVESLKTKTFTVRDSVESHYYRELYEGDDPAEPTCMILQAKLSAALSVITGEQVDLTENTCRSLGADACTFEVVDHDVAD